MKNKKIITFLAVATLIFNNLVVTGPVFAESSQTNKDNFFMSIFHKFMKKFGFEKDGGQGNKTGTPEAKLTPPADGTPMPTPSGNPPKIDKNQKGQKQQTDEERLAKLVKEGKITEEQKTLILAELKTLKEKYSMESLKDLTEEERKTKMEEMTTALKAWAKEQGIDEKYVVFGQPQGGNGPQGQNPGQGQPPLPTTTE